MNLINSHNRQSIQSTRTRYETIVRNDAITVQGGDKGKEKVSSGNFAATIIASGVREQFIELQKHLSDISEISNELKSFASGEIFNGLYNEFYSKDKTIFNNTQLFGCMEPEQEGNAIQKLNRDLKRIANGSHIIVMALDLIYSMQERISDILNNMQSDFILSQSREEDLLAWAYRKGVQLNPEVLNMKRLGVITTRGTLQIDYYGLLNMLDNLQLHLETLKYLPAYYRTGNQLDTNRLDIPVKQVVVGDNETIQRIAERELGDADKANLILEFNDLSYMDIISDDWAGTTIKIPYRDINISDRLNTNNVLDKQSGIEVLGRDIDANMEIKDGTLKSLGPTDNFLQSINNILLSPYGSIAEQPVYGNRILALSNEMLPEIKGKAIEVEVRRAIMSNPRVAKVDNVQFHASNDTIRVKYQVTAINNLSENELETNLGTS